MSKFTESSSDRLTGPRFALAWALLLAADCALWLVCGWGLWRIWRLWIRE